MAYFRSGGGIAASEQFSNYNQTDVFSVNQNGQLTVSWVTGAGEWQGPIEIGPTGLAPEGCAVAACQQFGINQTDVFLVDNHGQLNVFYLFQGGSWSGPVKIGPTGLAPAGCPLAVSQQIGINQTDVFLIDNNGQLNVFYVFEAQAWGGPVKVGPTGLAPAGANVAASRQFGLDQTDVFVVDKTGQLNVFYVVEAGAWGGPVKIGAAGFANPGCALTASQQMGINQTDLFVVDKTGQLNVFYVVNAGPWNGPVKIGPANFANPGSALAASRQFAPNLNQTDVFVVDKTGQLNVFYVVQAGPWNGPVKIGPAGNAAAGATLAASQQIGINQTDVFLIDNNGQLNIFYVYEQAAWNGPVVRGNPVAAPSSGLGSNSNYFLHANGASLTGVVITINVSQDITGSDGFGFQLNAYSAKSDYDAAQQYLIYLNPKSSPAALTAMVDNWTASNTQIENVQEQMATLSSHTLPAGYQLVISLQNDSNGNITGARYQAFNNQGKSIGDKTITLTSQSGITSKDEAPIVAFQIDFVDYLNGGTTTLSSGAGLIGYYASTEMTVSNSVPSFVDWSYVTVEKANSVYGGMSSTPSHSFAQTFGYSATGKVIQKHAPVEHETRAVDVLAASSKA